ncbi:DUF3306 domain-containing protein [Bradyrhizobium lablabi]|uniref:DUF3306 domain-containing protein n=1 Tax=Bradyrhizobium lablabi TaxID=722472 RepID=UPI001BA6148E|nr:DUF3306 domain-containing protein [Bradyrhizobium lablabi]MBR0693184.1 DUF3306 domain-containing protein [Bradyrhizobium lablabi]
MSEQDFLARWSRRKQAAKGGHAEARPDEPIEANETAPSDGTATEQHPSEVDLSNLPPLESIDAATDVTAFLRRGIPQELSRAALRRAWSADPAIRDFVGLAENAWDFNDPNAIPGFGPLDYSAEQVDALVRRVLGDVVQAVENAANPSSATGEDAARSTPVQADPVQAFDPVQAVADIQTPDEVASAELPSCSAAPQPPVASEEIPVRRRTHGGALPR